MSRSTRLSPLPLDLAFKVLPKLFRRWLNSAYQSLSPCRVQSNGFRSLTALTPPLTAGGNTKSFSTAAVQQRQPSPVREASPVPRTTKFLSSPQPSDEAEAAADELSSSPPLAPVGRSELHRKRAQRFIEEQKALEHPPAAFGTTTTVAPTAHRAPLSRTELQRMRSARLHAEEKVLYDGDSRAAKLGKLPASVGASMMVAAVAEVQHAAAPQPKLDRAALQRMRAARLHSEEASLYLLDAKAAVSGGEADTATPEAIAVVPDGAPLSRAELQRMRAARMHAEEAELDGAGAEVLPPFTAPASTTNAHPLLDRTVLHRMRAARMHEEQAQLELLDAKAHTADPASEEPSPAPRVINRTALHQMRSARLHSEERSLHALDSMVSSARLADPAFRRQLHSMKAARMHAEQRLLDGTLEALADEIVVPLPAPVESPSEFWDLGPTCYPTRFDLQSMRAMRSATEERGLWVGATVR